jgi:hypothetical protein
MANLQVNIYPGTLRASTGLTSKCKVEVRKIRGYQKAIVQSRFEIVSVAKPLPDGEYELAFRDVISKVRCDGGCWDLPSAESNHQ